jgi:hypothetical protein
MKTDNDPTGLHNRKVCLWIFAIIVLLFALLSCTKEPEQDYRCEWKEVKSAPGYKPDSVIQLINKKGVILDEILSFQNNWTYSFQDFENGVFVTTVSTMVCKNVTCYN